jgi:hypothetical protein
MSNFTDENNNGINKKQENKEATANKEEEYEIEETLENASDKVVTESRKEVNQIGDSDRE